MLFASGYDIKMNPTVAVMWL